MRFPQPTSDDSATPKLTPPIIEKMVAIGYHLVSHHDNTSDSREANGRKTRALCGQEFEHSADRLLLREKSKLQGIQEKKDGK